MNNGVRQTNAQVIREILGTNPYASKTVIEQVAGRRIHSPDLAKVRKEMGIVWKQGMKAPSQVTQGVASGTTPSKPRRKRVQRRAPSIRMTTRLPDGGIACLSSMIELVRTHGLDTVKKAAEAVSSF